VPVENPHFKNVIDYLRDRRDEEVSLSDVVALAEITAESFNAFYKTMDAAIYRELREIATYITTMKEEIGALQANDMKSQRIPAAGRELDLIVQSTAEATNAIMECAEAIMAADASDAATYKAFVDEKMIVLFEACSFQDITGQRIKKVITTLRHIEDRVSRFAGALGVQDGAAQETEDEKRNRELILNGPAKDGPATSQDDIDAMFA
jgi:chemotaxis protein CheZ